MKTRFNIKQHSLKFALISAFAFGSAVIGGNSQAAQSTGATRAATSQRSFP